MAQLSSLPQPLVAGTSENIADVVTNLEALRNAVNGIDADQINAGAVGVSELAVAITNSLVPLGTVIDWYPPSSAAAPWTAAMPTGYAACDGTAWASIVNDLGFTSGNIPNLVGQLISGATFANGRGAGDGVAGARGSSSRTITTAQLPSHNHSVDGGGLHDHTIASSGTHQHGISNSIVVGGGGPYWVSANGSSGFGPGAQVGWATDAGAGAHTHSISSSGSHSHTGGYTGSGSALDVTPATIGLLKIMKVRNTV